MVDVQMLNGMAEIYSTVRKSIKENKECTNGDYWDCTKQFGFA